MDQCTGVARSRKEVSQGRETKKIETVAWFVSLFRACVWPRLLFDYLLLFVFAVREKETRQSSRFCFVGGTKSTDAPQL
jgi:hypothetical protein